MKRNRPNYEPVGDDGWIALAPGNWVSFHIDTQIKPSLYDLTAWFRSLRGNFLAEAFGVENDLILLILAFDFNVADANSGGTAYVTKEKNLRAEHSFHRKIEGAKAAIRKHFDHQAANRLIGQLAECRTIRNLLAHYPCWLEPTNNESTNRTIGFKLLIGDQTHIWDVDEAQAKVWFEPFFEIRRGLISVRHRILGLPEPTFSEGSWALVNPADDVRAGGSGVPL